MRTLSEKLVKIQFFKFLWNPSGFGLTQRANMWMVGKREKGELWKKNVRFFFHSVVYWNHILGGVHDMI